MKVDLLKDSWKYSNVQAFWGEVAPCDHLVQIYDNEMHFLNTLEGFAGSGILSDDNVIIIATQEHLSILAERLTNQGFNIDELVSEGRYFPLDAAETLNKFMIDNSPDEMRFMEVITTLMSEAQKGGKKVRAFGEMVAILWEKGLHDATVQLENLWHKLHSTDRFSLYCAYPKNGFTRNSADSIQQICSAHTKIIDGQNRPSTEIYYSVN